MATERYFPNWIEFAVLWFPALGLPLSLLQGTFFPIERESLNEAYLRFFETVILLDFIHIGLPFAILMGTTGGAAFLQKKLKSTKPGKIGALLIAGFTLYLLCVLGTIGPGALTGGYALTSHFVLGALVILPPWHSIKQSWGLGLLMNRQLISDLTAERKARLRKSENREFWMIHGIILFILIQLTMIYFGPNIPWLASLHRLLDLPLQAIVVLLTVGVVANTYLDPMFKGTAKRIYVLRFVLLPLIPFSIFAMWFILLNHALEYVGLFSRVLEKTGLSLRSSKLGFYSIMFSIFLFGVAAYWLAREFWKPEASPGLILILVLTLKPFLALVHYYADRKIYRLSDPEAVRSFGPLFLPNSEPVVALAKSPRYVAEVQRSLGADFL